MNRFVLGYRDIARQRARSLDQLGDVIGAESIILDDKHVAHSGA
jgi:hypothetical protein